MMPVLALRAQVPPEVYELFSAAGKKGAAAEKEWDSTWASYKEKYPEVRRCFSTHPLCHGGLFGSSHVQLS